VIAAVVLAAGAATRYGAPKQREFLPRVLAALRASPVDDIVVVAGAYPLQTDARVVECPDWERGPGASLRCGLAALSAGVEAAVVVLADGPELAPAAIDRVADVWRETGAEVIVATYGGVRGHPVLIARSAWRVIPDEGARALEALAVPCDDLGSPGDIDFSADLPGRFRTRAAELKRDDGADA
jgi:CTP:molybdopterin cytidylyltransferase MocA